MRNLLNKLKTLTDYLVFQIFAYFWLTFAILLALVLTLPNFDARIFTGLEENEKKFFLKESEITALRYNLNEIFNKRLIVTTKNDFNIILMDPKTNATMGVDDPEQNKYLQVFIYTANNPALPLKRLFNESEIYGPFLVKEKDKEYYQYFIKHVDAQKELVNWIFDSPWIMLLSILFVSIPLLLWLAWRIAKPVQKLRIAANTVATGDFSTNKELEIDGIYELREVGKSFNQMICSLQDLASHQQRLLSDISHELKTPLTRLQLATAIIRRRNGDSNELTRIDKETERLDTMIHDLLSLSRHQLNQHVSRSIFSINQIWENVFDDAKFETEQNQIDLFISQRILHPEKYFINGSLSMLSSALENVIRNAQKYANHSIKVLTYIDKTDLYIIIDDDGVGVPENEYSEIFRPFYRVDEARARETGGTGLGLAIVANALKQHHGNVIAKKSPLGGLRIKMRLPLWLE